MITRFTVLPFLVSFLISLSGLTPTNVVAVNRDGMGHEHEQPWRSTALTGARARIAETTDRLTAALADLWGHPLRSPMLAGAAVLVAAVVLPDTSHELLAVVGLIGLQEARQTVADIDRRLSANETRSADITREINAITDAVQAAVPPRPMTDEEKVKLVDLRKQKTSVSELRSVLMEQKADASQQLVAAEAANEVERNAKAVTDPDMRVGKDRTEDDPKRGFKTHREFMTCVMAAGKSNGANVDARLKPLQPKATAGADEHGTYSDPSAAFLIPVGFSPDILSVAAEADPTAALTRKLPMDAPMVKINARVDKNHATSVSGGLRVYRHSETQDATSSRIAFEQLTFNAEDLIGLAYATENQIADSPGSFVAMLSDGFRDEFAAKLLNEKIRGVGAAGQYTGILTAAALVTVDKETGQAADTIVVENIDKMAARSWRYTSPSTVWLANQTTRPQLRGLTRNVGTGGAPVNYFTNEGGVERLDGRLIFFTEFASAIGDLGDLMLVTFSEYIEGLYQPLQQAESIHVRFAANERAFKFWVRNCGQCWWSVALTPNKGVTLSPLVTLQAR